MPNDPERHGVFARSAWGCAVFTAVASLAALGVGLPWPGQIGALAAIGFATGAAAVWWIVLTPLAYVGAVALPGMQPPHTARMVKTAAFVFVLELGAGIAAVHWAEHHVMRAALARVFVAIAIGLAVLVVLGFRRTIAPSPRSHRVMTVTASALPAIGPALVWLGLPAHVRGHVEVPWSLLCAAALPYVRHVPMPSARWVPRVCAALGLAAVVWLAVGFDRRPGLAASLLARHVPVRTAVALGRTSGDLDGDGSAAWFGGRDCAAFDPQRGPGAVEIAGNGIDDNCLLGDLEDDTAPIVITGEGGARTGLVTPNVLVISVDALRPDRMSAYGYARPTTPSIDAAFADAVRFTHAYSEAASTRDTLPSLLSGRRRAELEWHRNGAVVLDPGTTTAAHTFAAHGYATFAVLPFVALNMIGGTDLGFVETTIYDEKPTWTAAGVNAALLAAIDRATGPFFAFAHYYEPHEPYVRHRAHAKVSDLPYDQEVAAVDAAIGDLLEALAARGVLANTILVLTSDHGEAFGEHGHRFHNEDVYEEDLRVPWLLRMPGVSGRDVTTPVSTTALVATLYDALGWPAVGAHGPTVASVWPLLANPETEAEAALVIAVARATLDRERWTLVRDRHKLLFDRQLAAFELFDLETDPQERHDRSATTPELADAMLAEAAWMLEHVIGASDSRRVRSRGLDVLPSHAIVADGGAPEGVAGAWAEISRGVDGSGLPPRVLVHTLIRTDRPVTYQAVLVEDGRVVASVDEPSGPINRQQPLHDDVRTFKVYVEDVDREVEVRHGEHRIALGRVRELGVDIPTP